MNIFYNILNLSRFNKKFILITLDSIVLFFSSALSYLIIFSEYEISNNSYKIFINLNSININLNFYTLSLITFLNMIVLIYLNFYDSLFRYRGLRTVLNLLIRLITNLIILVPLSFVIFYFFFEQKNLHFYYSTIYFFLLFLIIYIFIVSSQYFFIRTIILNLYKKGKKENILIYGAGSAGYIFSKQIIDYNILGFIDDDKQKIGYKINNFSIKSLEDYDNLIKNKLVSHILILIPSLNYADRKKIIKKLLNYKIPFRFLNSADNLIKNNLNPNQFQNISPNELIDRIINWDIYKIKKEFSGSNILVTGAGGSIGGDLSIKLSKLSVNNLILFDLSEYNLFEIKNSISEEINKNKTNSKNIKFILGSVLDATLIKNIIIKYSITHIIHAAAFKHVELCEINKFQCLSNNFISTTILADLSIEYNVKKFLLISTDKSIRPSTIMGFSKKISEQYIQFLSKENFNKTIFFGVRFGNVIGSKGSAIPIFQKQINEKKPVTLTHPDMQRYLMSIDDASNLILEAHALAKSGYIYILNMGKPIKIIEIINKMVNYAGLSIKSKENPKGDLEIKIIGQKKGEKLNEELFNSSDYSLTENKDIFFENKIFDDIHKTSQDLKDAMLKIIKNEDINELNKLLTLFKNVK